MSVLGSIALRSEKDPVGYSQALVTNLEYKLKRVVHVRKSLTEHKTNHAAVRTALDMASKSNAMKDVSSEVLEHTAHTMLSAVDTASHYIHHLGDADVDEVYVAIARYITDRDWISDDPETGMSVSRVTPEFRQGDMLSSIISHIRKDPEVRSIEHRGQSHLEGSYSKLYTEGAIAQSGHTIPVTIWFNPAQWVAHQLSERKRHRISSSAFSAPRRTSIQSSLNIHAEKAVSSKHIVVRDASGMPLEHLDCKIRRMDTKDELERCEIATMDIESAVHDSVMSSLESGLHIALLSQMSMMNKVVRRGVGWYAAQGLHSDVEVSEKAKAILVFMLLIVHLVPTSVEDFVPGSNGMAHVESIHSVAVINDGCSREALMSHLSTLLGTDVTKYDYAVSDSGSAS